MSLGQRDTTRNQTAFDADRKKLLVFGNSFKAGTYRNVSGGAESVAIGTLMGVIAASGKWTVCKSGAADGSQIPRGIMLDELTAIADVTDVSNINLVTAYTMSSGTSLEVIKVAFALN